MGGGRGKLRRRGGGTIIRGRIRGHSVGKKCEKNYDFVVILGIGVLMSTHGLTGLYILHNKMCDIVINILWINMKAKFVYIFLYKRSKILKFSHMYFR